MAKTSLAKTKSTLYVTLTNNAKNNNNLQKPTDK